MGKLTLLLLAILVWLQYSLWFGKNGIHDYTRVNDDVAVLGTLLRKLTAIGVDPYYIFQCRPVKGIRKMFQVPLTEAVQIVDRAKNVQNGIGKSVRFVMSHPRGKIEILGKAADDALLFKFHQAKCTEDAARIFCVKVKPDTIWLDADLRGDAE